MKFILRTALAAVVTFATLHLYVQQELHAQTVPPAAPCACSLGTNTFGVTQSYGRADSGLSCALLSYPDRCQVTGTVTFNNLNSLTLSYEYRSPLSTVVESGNIASTTSTLTTGSYPTTVNCAAAPGPKIEYRFGATTGAFPGQTWLIDWTCDVW